MDFNDFLLWMTVASLIMSLPAIIGGARGGDASLLWVLAGAAVVAGLGAWALPAYGGIIAGTLWLLVAVVPGRVLRWATAQMRRGRPRLATGLARLAVVLQPTRSCRAVAAAISAASGRNPHSAEPGSQGGGALWELVTLKQMQAWELIRQRYPGPTGEPHIDAIRARALGETGSLDAMLRESVGLAGRFPGPEALTAVSLPALAFAGRSDLVQRLSRRARLDRRERTYWLATAAWAAGDGPKARRDLEAIAQEVPQQKALQAAITWRLAHPPAAAADLGVEARHDVETLARLVREQVVRPTVAWCTFGLIAINILVEIIARVVGPMRVITWGAFSIPEFLAGQWWRVFTALFIHLGLLHIGTNMLGLVWYGPSLERAFGRLRFLVVYLASGLLGLALIMAQHAAGLGGSLPVIGASGCVLGVIAADMMLLWRRGRSRSRAEAARLQAFVMMILIQLVFDHTHPMVSATAHVGGLVAGAILALLLMPRRPLTASSPPPLSHGLHSSPRSYDPQDPSKESS